MKTKQSTTTETNGRVEDWATSNDVALRYRAAQHPELPRESLVE
jgi:hypothetical protein